MATNYLILQKNYLGTYYAFTDTMLSDIPVLLVALVLSGLVVIALLVATFFTVEQRTAAVVQRLGKSRAIDGPRRESVPGSSGNSGRADAAIPMGGAQHE